MDPCRLWCQHRLYHYMPSHLPDSWACRPGFDAGLTWRKVIGSQYLTCIYSCCGKAANPGISRLRYSVDGPVDSSTGESIHTKVLHRHLDFLRAYSGWIYRVSIESTPASFGGGVNSSAPISGINVSLTSPSISYITSGWVWPPRSNQSSSHVDPWQKQSPDPLRWNVHLNCWLSDGLTRWPCSRSSK